jgi:hypothetical protein
MFVRQFLALVILYGAVVVDVEKIPGRRNEMRKFSLGSVAFVRHRTDGQQLVDIVFDRSPPLSKRSRGSPCRHETHEQRPSKIISFRTPRTYVGKPNKCLLESVETSFCGRRDRRRRQRASTIGCHRRACSLRSKVLRATSLTRDGALLFPLIISLLSAIFSKAGCYGPQFDSRNLYAGRDSR